jgi:Holliday junction DNA helicase RuvA
MIGRIRGTLLEKSPPYILVDVQGVGYELEAPTSTFARLPEPGQPITLHTHLIVREDAHVLCGFISEEERRLFRLLIKVNSVGAKLALGILSGISANEFIRCVQEKNTAALTRLPGVGKKTAERLIIEMRDRLVDIELPELKHAPGKSVEQGINEAARDAISALVSLGYKPQEASRLLQHVDTEGRDMQTILKAALKAATVS